MILIKIRILGQNSVFLSDFWSKPVVLGHSMSFSVNSGNFPQFLVIFMTFMQNYLES